MAGGDHNIGVLARLQRAYPFVQTGQPGGMDGDGGQGLLGLQTAPDRQSGADGQVLD